MPDDLLPLLRSYFPRAFPNRENPLVIDLVALNAGWETDVYAFSAESGPPSHRMREDFILRIYPGEDGYEKSAGEFRSLAFLRQAGYPVPRVDCLEREQSPFGRPFLIMERIHGHAMWDCMFNGAPEEQHKRLVQFCGLFARLHAIDWRPFVPNAAEFEPAGPYALMERQFARWEQYVESMPLPGFQAGWTWLVDRHRRVTSTAAAPVHWDFHPNNMLIKDNWQAEDGEEIIVIDWSSLDLTDYRFDLAWTLLLLTTYEGPQWREPILREYERQAGHPVEGIEFFDAVASFRRLVSVVGSLVFGAEKLGMRPGAEETMRHQVVPLSRVYDQFQNITGVRIPEVEDFLSDARV